MTDIEKIKREVSIFISNKLGITMMDVIDYLHSRGYLGGVADGYVLVPKEPTFEMIGAAIVRPPRKNTAFGEMYRDIYEAMIAAAPKGETK